MLQLIRIKEEKLVKVWYRSDQADRENKTFAQYASVTQKPQGTLC